MDACNCDYGLITIKTWILSISFLYASFPSSVSHSLILFSSSLHFLCPHIFVFFYGRSQRRRGSKMLKIDQTGRWGRPIPMQRNRNMCFNGIDRMYMKIWWMDEHMSWDAGWWSFRHFQFMKGTLALKLILAEIL